MAFDSRLLRLKKPAYGNIWETNNPNIQVPQGDIASQYKTYMPPINFASQMIDPYADDISVDGVTPAQKTYSPYTSDVPPALSEIERQMQLPGKNEPAIRDNRAEIAQMKAEQDAYNKMMMEDYLNKQAFGAGSQVTGTMPYYADRMGRGIQSGNIGQAIGGGLGFLFQGFKGAMAGAGQQKTEDFLRTEGQQKMREYMKAGKGRESLYGNYAMGYSGNFAEGGEMPMEEQMPMEQEAPQEQMQQMPQGEDVIFAYFEANQFNEQQAQEFMQYFQSLAPEEQQAAIQEMAAALSPQQGEQSEQEEMEEEPTILDGKTMSESTKVVRKGKKDFLQIIQETPISKKEAKDFRKYL